MAACVSGEARIIETTCRASTPCGQLSAGPRGTGVSGDSTGRFLASLSARSADLRRVRQPFTGSSCRHAPAPTANSVVSPLRPGRRLDEGIVLRRSGQPGLFMFPDGIIGLFFRHAPRDPVAGRRLPLLTCVFSTVSSPATGGSVLTFQICRVAWQRALPANNPRQRHVDVIASKRQSVKASKRQSVKALVS
jgi:hypothetical protein